MIIYQNKQDKSGDNKTIQKTEWLLQLKTSNWEIEWSFTQKQV